MKRSLLVLAMVSCGGHAATPSPPRDPRELRITLSPRVVGLVLEEDRSRSLDVMVDGKHVVERTDQKSRAVVMAVTDGRITQIATTYLEYTYDARHGGQVRPTPPLEGHTYIVTVEGDDLQVKREGGEELTAYERAAVLKDHRNLGMPGGPESLIASRRWQLEEAVVLDAAQQERFLGEPSEGTLTLKLIELTDETARFELEGRRAYGDGVSASVHGLLTLEPHTGRVVARIGEAQLTGAWTGHAEEYTKSRETPPAK